MTTPSDLEHQLLLAVWQLGQDAYGVTVRDALEHHRAVMKSYPRRENRTRIPLRGRGNGNLL